MDTDVPVSLGGSGTVVPGVPTLPCSTTDELGASAGAAARICPSALHLAKGMGKSCMGIEQKGGETGTEAGLLDGQEWEGGQ